MSAEYAMRMEVLRGRREDLTARRVAIEKKIALREATAAEFSAVALQSYTHKWKRLRTAAVAAKTRNDEFVRLLHATQQKATEAFLKHKNDLTSSAALLEQEKVRYVQRIEAVYPAWQEQLQGMRLKKLQTLEEKKRAVERRRFLAKKTFEKERSLDDLIRQTSHEIALSENLEKNEAYERELLRRQSTVQATRLDHTIREHALGARSFMAQQAQEHIREAAFVDEHVAETLFDTFSPRGALQALRQANSSLSFSEYEEKRELPQRSISIQIPHASVRHTGQEAHPPRHAPAEVHHASQRRFPTVDAHSNQFQHQAPVMPSHELSFPPHPVDSNQDTHWTAHRETVAEQAPTVPTTQAISNNNNDDAIHAAWRLKVAPPAYIEQALPAHSTIQRSDLVASTHPALEISASYSTTTHDHPKITTNGAEAASSVQHSAVALATPLQPVIAAPVAVELSQPATVSQIPDPPSPDMKAPLVVEQLKPSPESKPDPAPTAFQEVAATLPQQQVQLAESAVLSDAKSSYIATSVEQKQAKAPNAAKEVMEASDIRDAEEKKNEQHSALDASYVARFGSVNDSFGGLSESMASDGIMFVSHDASASGFSPLEREQKTVDLTLNIVNSFDSSASIITMNSMSQSQREPEARVAGEAEAVVTSVASNPQARVANSVEGLDDLDESKSMASPDRGFGLLSMVEVDQSVTQDDEEHVKFFNASSDSLSFPTSTHRQDERHRESKKYTVSAVSSAPSDQPRRDDPASAANSTADSPDSKISAFLRGNSNVSVEEVSHGEETTAGFVESGKLREKSGNESARESEKPPKSVATPAAAEEKPVEEKKVSPTEKLSMADKLKVLGALTTRVEDGAAEGDPFSASIGDSGSTVDTKRELVRMAAGGRKAQINFFGSDVCFELVLDIARELGPVLFPSRAFEGIMSEQKIKKVHQNSKDKELELWKLLSTHLKQLVVLKALSVAAVAELFGNTFLNHDPTNQRSQRKMKELLFSVCGTTASSVSPRKDSVASSSSPNRSHQQQRRGGEDEVESSSPDPGKQPQQQQQPQTPRFETPSLLQTAFLQHQSPPKPKTFGLASAGLKKKSDSQDVLKSMASSPAKLSHKLMRGGKMRDYSEFEEEEEVDLQNLIGSKSRATASHGSATSPAPMGAGGGSYKPAASVSAASTRGRAAKEDNDFDVDF